MSYIQWFLLFTLVLGFISFPVEADKEELEPKSVPAQAGKAYGMVFVSVLGLILSGIMVLI